MGLALALSECNNWIYWIPCQDFGTKLALTMHAGTAMVDCDLLIPGQAHVSVAVYSYAINCNCHIAVSHRTRGQLHFAD